MPSRLAGLLAAMVAVVALAQGPCESRCNLEGSECLKACSGEAKEGLTAEGRARLMRCLTTCEASTRQCKAACAPAREPRDGGAPLSRPADETSRQPGDG